MLRRGSPRLAGCVAFAASLAVYAVTMAPSLPPGHDSAELTTAAALPGIAHPPGYPLYTMLGYLATRLPAGDPAWRMNLLSALFGALAVGLAAAAFARLSRSPLAGAAAALAFAFARTPWRLAVGAEVFSLHLALEAGLLLAASAWRDADGASRRRLVVLQALLLGLALAHHHTIVLLLPGLAAWLWLARDGRPAGLTPWALPALALGLLPYLYLPLRAAANPALNWGDPDDLERLAWVVARQGYGSLRLSSVSGAEPAKGAHLQAWARSLATVQFQGLAALLGLAGALVALARRRPEGLLLGGLWLLAGPVWALVGAQPAGEGYLDMMERFYASSYLGFAGLVALGLGEGLRWLEERDGQPADPAKGPRQAPQRRGAGGASTAPCRVGGLEAGPAQGPTPTIQSPTASSESLAAAHHVPAGTGGDPATARRAPTPSDGGQTTADRPRLAHLAAVGLVLLLPLIALAVNWNACSERGCYPVPDALAAMSDPLPPGSLVVTGSDLTSGAFLYARLVQGRPLDQLVPGLASSEWYLEQLPPDRAAALRAGGLQEALVQARQAGVPVYLDSVPPDVQGFFVPEGLLFRYLAPGEPIPERAEASRRSLAILDGHPRRGPYPLRPDQPFWTRHLIRTWVWAYATAGEGLLDADPAEAARALEMATSLDPWAPEAWVTLGRTRLATGRVAAAGEAFRRALALEPDSPGALDGLLQVAEAEGRPEEAQQLRDRLQEVTRP